MRLRFYVVTSRKVEQLDFIALSTSSPHCQITHQQLRQIRYLTSQGSATCTARLCLLSLTWLISATEISAISHFSSIVELPKPKATLLPLPSRHLPSANRTFNLTKVIPILVISLTLQDFVSSIDLRTPRLFVPELEPHIIDFRHEQYSPPADSHEWAALTTSVRWGE